MIAEETRVKYTPTIGIECHVQLKTKTKLFAAVGNDAREAPPNTLVSHICFGLPGALPVLNKEAVRLAARAAFALGSEPARFSKFDRKHYFYPDLPKGYQISQYDQPIISGGHVDVPVIDKDTREARSFRVGIVRAHLEEDAGKSTHPAGADYSLVDLNRAGTPLLEIVSEPDIHSPEEAKAYARELYLRMKYADISEANLYYGNMRFDVNVSVSSDPSKLGTRTETKNLNSFRSVEKTVEYEITRQIEVLEKGGEIVQETRGWDDAKQRTFAQRSKEEAHDYRYMPDPDLPPVVLDEQYVVSVRAEMPALPDAWRERLSKLGLDQARTELLLSEEADSSLNYLETIAQVAEADKSAALFAANYLINRDISFRQKFRDEHEATGARVVNKLPTSAQLLDTYRLYKAGSLSSNKGDELLWKLSMSQDTTLSAEIYAKEHGYAQMSDESAIMEIVQRVLAENEKAAADVKGGEAKAIGFLVGQVMKASQGKANPGLAQSMIRKQLGM